MPDFSPGTLRYRSSRGCSFANPRQSLDPCRRRIAHGPIQPMAEPRPGFFARLRQILTPTASPVHSFPAARKAGKGGGPVSDEDIVMRLPYPRNLEDAAQLAVEAAWQEMSERGAFDEHELPESGRIFGKACAYTALKQLCAAAINETMPTVAEQLSEAATTLKRMLERYPDRAHVEFEDKTANRICPTNSSYRTERNGVPILRICNTLGEHRG